MISFSVLTFWPICTMNIFYVEANKFVYHVMIARQQSLNSLFWHPALVSSSSIQHHRIIITHVTDITCAYRCTLQVCKYVYPLHLVTSVCWGSICIISLFTFFLCIPYDQISQLFLLMWLPVLLDGHMTW